MTFGKVISSIRLQKSDLERIFYYAYKYKIATYISNLLFYQSGDLKTAIAIFLYSMKISLLLSGGLGYT